MKVMKSFTIDEELLPKIKKESKKRDRSESSIVNQLIKDHYNKNGK